jgi:GTPase SAR1 family protein
MLDWLTKRKTTQGTSEAIQSNGVLRVIGDRASGKTTYMASLARWPNAEPSSPVQNVTPVNEEGEELIAKAQNILEQGLELEPTDLNASAIDVKDYTLSIALKGQFSWKNPKASAPSQLVTLNISCKDYAGEFFTDLLYQAGDSRLQDYLEDCLQATGIMFLIDGTTHRKDSEYANGLDKFLMALDRTDIGAEKRRVGLVMTKCEQPELWIKRQQPRELAAARFPQVNRKLQSWQQMGAGSVEFFTTSAFGMLGTRYPEPNSKRINRDRNGTTSVLKDPKRWRPFGLVAPIYWLCTGDRHKELDKD